MFLNKRAWVFLITLLLLSMVLTSRTVIPPARAAPQGKVCIIDPGATLSPTSGCPANSSAFSGPTQTEITTVGGKSQLRVNVNAEGTSTFNGFDIILLTDHTKLLPFDADLSSSILSSTPIQALCVAGTQLIGSCALAAQNLDSLEMNIGGTTFTTPPTSGVLFTAIYDIVGDTSTSTTIGFQTGCGTVTSLPPTCVTLTSGGSAADQIISVSTATYSTATAGAQQFFTLTTIPTTFQVVRGASVSALVTIHIGNGFSCGGFACIGVLGRVSPVVASGPTVSVSPIPPWLETTAGTTATVTTTGSTPLGTFKFTVESSIVAPPLPGVTYLASSFTFTVQVVDFTISASPTSLTVLAGTANNVASSTLTLTSLGFTGTLAVGTAITPAGAVTTTLNGTATAPFPVPLTPGQTKFLILSVTSGTVTGLVTVTVRASGGGALRLALVAVTVLSSSDFFLTSKPSSVSVLAGATGSSTISVNGGSASSGTVNLSITSTSPATGLSCNALSQSSISLPLGGDSILSCSSSLAMTFAVTVTGMGTTVHTTTVNFIVKDFALASDRPSDTVIVGQQGFAMITATSQNGFTGNITLTSSPSPSAGISCVFQVPSGTSSSGFIVIPPTAGSSLIKCTGFMANSFDVTVTATFNTLVHSLHVTFIVQGFSISAAPTSVPVAPNTSGTSTISVSSLQGFGSPSGVSVALSFEVSPAGLTCSLTSTIVTLNNNVATSTLSCQSATANTFQVKVTGKSGSLSQDVTVTYTVGVPQHSTSTSVACTPNPVQVNTATSCTSTVTDGSTTGATTPTGTVTFTGGTGSFSPTTCSLAATATAGQAKCSVNYTPNTVGTDVISAGYGGDSSHSLSASIGFSLTVSPPPFDYSLSNSGPVTVQAGGSATVTITATLKAGTAVSVTLSCVAASLPTGVSCSFNPPSVTPTLAGATSVLTIHTTASTPTGPFTLAVTGSPLGATATPTSFTVTITAPPSDYSLANSGGISVQQGNSNTNTITVTLVAGTAQSVTLSCVAVTLPAGASCSFNPASLTPTLAGVTSTLTVSTMATTPTGTFQVQVTGSPLGSTTVPTIFTLTVTAPSPAFDYSLSNSGPVSIVQGSSGTNTITVTLTSGTAQAVTLSCVAPLPVGVTCTFGTNPVTPTAAGATSIVTIHTTALTPTGPFILSVTGSPLGKTTASTSFTVTITPPPFDYSLANSGPVSIVQGNSGTNTITVTLSSGAAQAVTLSCVAPLPIGVSCSFATNPVTPTAAGVTSVLTIHTTAASPTGSFTLSVTGNPLGATTIATSFTVTVTTPPPSAFDYSLSNSGPVTVQAGGSATVTITATLKAGVAVPVTLSCVAPPAGVTCTFDTNPVTPTAAGVTSLLHIATSSSTTSFTIMVTASPLGATTTPTSVSVTVTAPPPPSKAILLTFSAFNMDDFDDGVGQLQVLVNGHLVVDIPAGLNHPSGRGDFTSDTNTWVRFGPFDITSFVVQGQNTIVFMSSMDDHSLVKNVTITHGSTILLHIKGARQVSLSRPVTFTFSNPPLTIDSFTVSNPIISEHQSVTFTASYTGGTGPFRCTFRFDDGEAASTVGVSGSCSVTHNYDDTGTFTVSVTVRGVCTSDFVVASVTVNVPDVSNVGIGDQSQVPVLPPENDLEFDD